MIRIAVTGPESSGKTTLAKDLSRILEASLVEEYSREYLEINGPRYHKLDLIKIARENLRRIQTEEGNSIVCDTEFLVMKIWFEEKYGSIDPEIEKYWQETPFDLFVLCHPEIPWIPDPLRENPFDRDRLFDIYLKELEQSGKPFLIVRGSPQERIDQVLKALEGKIEG